MVLPELESLLKFMDHETTKDNTDSWGIWAETCGQVGEHVKGRNLQIQNCGIPTTQDNNTLSKVSSSENPFSTVHRKPEASNQTNDSQQ